MSQKNPISVPSKFICSLVSQRYRLHRNVSLCSENKQGNYVSKPYVLAVDGRHVKLLKYKKQTKGEFLCFLRISLSVSTNDFVLGFHVLVTISPFVILISPSTQEYSYSRASLYWNKLFIKSSDEFVYKSKYFSLTQMLKTMNQQ